MKSFLKPRFTLLILTIFSMACVVMTSTGCKKDPVEESCTGFPSLGGNITINGASQNLSAAQLLVNAGGATFGDDYSFQLGGVSSSCTQTAVTFTINIKSGTKLAGTYPIKDFFSADVNQAHASITKQSINPISQTLEDFISGTIKVTNNGIKDYTIDFNGKTTTGETVSMFISHKF